jgi:hypothetical protein
MVSIPVLVGTYFLVGQTRDSTYIHCTKNRIMYIHRYNIGFGRWSEEAPIPYSLALGPCVGLGEQKIDQVGLRGLVDGAGATNACVDQHAGRR